MLNFPVFEHIVENIVNIPHQKMTCFKKYILKDTRAH